MFAAFCSHDKLSPPWRCWICWLLASPPCGRSQKAVMSSWSAVLSVLGERWRRLTSHLIFLYIYIYIIARGRLVQTSQNTTVPEADHPFLAKSGSRTRRLNLHMNRIKDLDGLWQFGNLEEQMRRDKSEECEEVRHGRMYRRSSVSIWLLLNVLA